MFAFDFEFVFFLYTTIFFPGGLVTFHFDISMCNIYFQRAERVYKNSIHMKKNDKKFENDFSKNKRGKSRVFCVYFILRNNKRKN